MNLQRALDPLRLCLDCKALETYMGMIRWLLVYIYICIGYNPNLQHYFRSKLKFMHNPTLLSVMTPSVVR
jgi:hypothetical protein